MWACRCLLMGAGERGMAQHTLATHAHSRRLDGAVLCPQQSSVHVRRGVHLCPAQLPLLTSTSACSMSTMLSWNTSSQSR